MADETSGPTDFVAPKRIAADVFLALIGDGLAGLYSEETDCRSAAETDFVDVKFDGHWFRLRPEPIEEPISLSEHRGEAPGGQ
jgi:hypothetical protein